MAYPNLTLGDLTKVWGLLEKAAKDRQATRSVLQIARDSGQWVAHHITHGLVNEPKQSAGVPGAKWAYETVIHNRNVFNGYGNSQLVTSTTVIRLQTADAERLIKVCLYLSLHGGGTPAADAMAILHNNGWGNDINNVNQSWDGNLPTVT
jgi:hypothetical protein